MLVFLANYKPNFQISFHSF